MIGKRKCEILKEIRQRIADENEIPYKTHECNYHGECSGTCPRCESELHYLEKQLEKRISLGKKVKIGMLCAGMALSVTGCSQISSLNPFGKNITTGVIIRQDPTEEIEMLEGEVAYEPPEEDPEIQGTPTAQIQEIDEPFDLMGDFPDPNFIDND